MKSLGHSYIECDPHPDSIFDINLNKMCHGVVTGYDMAIFKLDEAPSGVTPINKVHGILVLPRFEFPKS